MNTMKIAVKIAFMAAATIPAAASAQEAGRMLSLDGGRFVVDFRTRNDTNQSKGNQYGGPRLFHCTCFLHGIII